MEKGLLVRKWENKIIPDLCNSPDRRDCGVYSKQVSAVDGHHMGAVLDITPSSNHLECAS